MKYTIYIPWCIFLSIYIFSSCVGEWKNEYEEHYSSIHTFHTSKKIEKGEPNFSISGALDLYRFPDKTGEKKILERIKKAEKQVWIAVYIWTNKNIANAVIDAKNRGVDVKIIVEPNVYKTPSINRSILSYFNKRGIDIMYSDNDRYKFTHAKFGIIDDWFFVSTGNLTFSLFKNREYMLFGTDTKIHTFLTSVFLADYEHKNISHKTIFPQSVALAPLNARESISALLENANTKIQIYIQYISDRELLNLLQSIKKNHKDIEIEICVSNTENNRDLASQFSELNWKIAGNPYLHAKVIIVDKNIVFLGSQNLSQNALDNNREVSLIFSHRPAITQALISDISSHCKDIQNKS